MVAKELETAECGVFLAPGVTVGHDSPVVHVDGTGTFGLDPATHAFLRDLAATAGEGLVAPRDRLTSDDSVLTSLLTLRAHGIVKLVGFGAGSNDPSDSPRYAAQASDLVVKRDIALLTRAVGRLSTALAPAWSMPLVITLAAALPIVLVALLTRIDVTLLLRAWIQSPVPTFAVTGAVTLVRTTLHEAGHVAAARRHGLDSVRCGVGFYLHMPVLYADVSAIDTAAKSARVHVDLAGVAMDSLILLVAASIAACTNAPLAAVVVAALAASSFGPLNPITKSDLNWCLRDLLGARSVTTSWGRPRDLARTALRAPNPREQRFAAALLVATAAGALALSWSSIQWLRSARGIVDDVSTHPASVLPFLAVWAVLVGGVALTARTLRRSRART